ncbi:secreted protein, partial [Mycobacterium tuberculosis variant africanum MAL010129]
MSAPMIGMVVLVVVLG